MEDLQTDTLSDYAKNQNQENADFDSSKDNENTCAANLLNGCEEIDPLDLMDHCDNESIGSNSDVWKGSDSEDENFVNKDPPGNVETSKTNNPTNTIEQKEENLPVGDKNPTNGTKTDKESDISVISENGATTETKSKESDKPEPATNQENKCNNGEKQPEEDEDCCIIESEEQNKPEKDNEKSDTYKIDPNSKQDDEVVECEIKETDKTVNDTNENIASTEKNKMNGDVNKDGTENVNTEMNDLINKDPLADDCQMIETSNDEDKSKEPSSAEGTSEKPTADDGSKPPTSEETNKEPTTTDANEAPAPVEADKEPTTDDANKETSESRPVTRYHEGDDDYQMEYDAADDDDFDPSLLCPEVSMAVDDNPVVTNNGLPPNDGDGDSPLPYEPLFSTFVDEVTGAEISFNLTAEEQELRKRLYGRTGLSRDKLQRRSIAANPVQMTRLHCTACNVHLGSALEGQSNRFVHPMLKVLICKECYHFYTSGEFEKDEDGSELYCRWCGQGGQVLCCSKCECVFCKRCIRTNFGRKKMFEIRDSDSWDCFRCNPSQIITQRIACYEFFEYVRTEMSKASTLNSSEIWSTDHSRCCNAKKRALENPDEVKKPKKKKGGERDPDYNPLAEKKDDGTDLTAIPSTSSSTPSTLQMGNKGFVLPKPIMLMPRFTMKPKDNDIEFVRQIPAPRVTINAAPRPIYRTILPSQIRPAVPTPPLVRISSQPVPPLVPTGNRILGNALHGRNTNANSMMKHEWFEKTVRAAARVNSHLSYTLTQLNKAQSQAASVEELAVVHNKLQEILSSSINSLIQIRKNLRTEFIAGIKTVRLPSKKPDLNNDDDVIFVSAPPVMPMPSTSILNTPPRDPLMIIDPPIPSTSMMNNNDSANNSLGIERPRTYLKVKSVMELQNVPSECITIPDDTPPPPPPPPPPPKINRAKNNTKSIAPVIICNGTSSMEDSDPSKAVDPLGDIPCMVQPIPTTSKGTVSTKNKAANSNQPVLPGKEPKSRKSKENTVFNLKGQPRNDVKQMMSVKVNIQRMDLKELQRKLSTKN